jgi:hypothetical protein
MSLATSLLPLKDALRYSRLLRHAGGLLAHARGLAAPEPAVRIARLTRALTMLESPASRARAVRALQRKPGFDAAAPWEAAVRAEPRYAGLLKEKPHLSRSVILKSPGPGGEKGVLLMTFEYNWARLLLGLDAEGRRWMDENYDLVLSTSWSPTDYAVLGLATACTTGNVFVQSCNYGEIAAIEAFHPRLRCLKTLPCDWINPVLYDPKPAAERETDIVMVANWGEFKRHWELFRALRHMPADLKIVLIGQREPGRSTETIRALAQAHGVPQKLEIHESIPIAEVARLQCQAKVSVIMTRREGCCVAAVESLFAGCALAMREDAHVGPLAYINEHTGQRLRPGHVHEDLMALLRRSAQLAPRQWSVENLACHLSREKLNTLLKTSAESQGRPWTRDIAQPHWRPHPTHAHEADRERLRPVYEELHQRFPQVFSADLIDTSWK